MATTTTTETITETTSHTNATLPVAHGAYWTCGDAHGGGCGVHHRTLVAAMRCIARHTRMLDREYPGREMRGFADRHPVFVGEARTIIERTYAA